MSKAGDRISSRSWLLLFDCHIPEAILACDDPQIASLSVHQSKSAKVFQILYFRAILDTICTDNAHKSMIKHYSWHKWRRYWLTKQSWGSGISSALSGVCSMHSRLHKVQWRIFQGCIKTNLLKMAEARPSAASWQPLSKLTLVLQNYQDI